MQKFGIDLSKWQGDFDIAKAKRDSGIEFTIIKCGGGDDGLYRDSQFENTYRKCETSGVDKGTYFYGCALTMEQAEKEANYILGLINGKKFEYPIFYDVEGDMLKLDKRLLTDIVKRVCSIIEGQGYWVGIYASLSTFEDEVYDNELAKYSHWVARWGTVKPTLSKGGETQMWQFGGETNKLRSVYINGVIVDQNYCYVDFPSKIKSACRNGYTKPVQAKKTDSQIALEVIDGKWGNGSARKQLLTEAGYDYNKIQKLVDQMLTKPVKSERDLALEVINGKWGNGGERKRRLTESGYNYSAIQKLVNEMLKA